MAHVSMLKLIAAAIMFGAVLPGASRADVTPVTPSCITEAAESRHVPIDIILALLKTEGGRLGMVSTNRDGSHDLGPMQINDRTWVPRIAAIRFSGNQQLAYESLRDDGCFNILVGASIFQDYLAEARGNFAEAVGFYNSHNEPHKHEYQMRFARAYLQLFGRP